MGTLPDLKRRMMESFFTRNPISDQQQYFLEHERILIESMGCAKSFFYSQQGGDQNTKENLDLV
jgi:hypothetical protein